MSKNSNVKKVINKLSYNNKLKETIQNPDKLKRTVGVFEKKFNKISKDENTSFRTIMSFVKHTITGKFRLERSSYIKLISAIVYVAMPLDLIPDFVIGLGYIDDTFIIALVLKSLTEEYSRFLDQYSEDDIDLDKIPNEDIVITTITDEDVKKLHDDLLDVQSRLSSLEDLNKMEQLDSVDIPKK